MPDSLSSESQDVWQRIGLLLALLQNAEHIINFCLRWVFTNDPFGDEDKGNLLDQLTNLKEFQRKKTLGQLHRALRERVELHPEFETYLGQFVEDRNRFTHKLFLETGFNINESGDTPRILEFVNALTNQTMTIMAVFHVFLETWKKEYGLADEIGYLNEPESFKIMVQHFKNHITKTA